MRRTPSIFRNGPTKLAPLAFLLSTEPWVPTDLGTDLLSWLRPNNANSLFTGGSRQFYSADKAAATLASFAAVNLSTADFSLNSQVYRDSTGNQVIMAKYQDANNYWRWEITAGHKLHFIAVIGGVTLIEVTGTTSLSTTGRWYQCSLAVDRDGAGTTEIYLNGVNDTSGTPTVSASTIDNTGAFWIAQAGDGTLYFNGRLQSLGVFKSKLISQTEATWLYGSANGRIYGELGEVGTDGASLAPSWWANCNETSATASIVDQASTNDVPLTFGELLTDPGLEDWASATDLTSWTEFLTGTSTVNREATGVHGGTYAARIDSDAGDNYVLVAQNGKLLDGHRYRIAAWAKAAAGQIILYAGHTVPYQVSITDSWSEYSATLTAGGSLAFIFRALGNPSGSTYFDDLSAKAVDVPAANGMATDIASDSSGNGNHAVCTNTDDAFWSTDTPAYPALQAGLSAQFDGVNDYLRSPISLASGNYSISVWIKKTSTAGGNYVIDFNSGNTGIITVHGGVNPHKILACGTGGYGGGAVNGTVVVDDGAWHHVCVTVTGTTLSIYVDGAFDASGTVSVGSASSCTIGNYAGPYDPNTAFNGYIDDIQIRSSALTAPNILYLATGGVPGEATATASGTDPGVSNLKGWWKLDDAFGGPGVSGDPIAVQSDEQGPRYIQGIAAYQPYLDVDALGVGEAGLIYGGNHVLKYEGELSTETSGTLRVKIKTPAAFATEQTIWSTADVGAANKWLQLAIDTARKVFFESNVSGTVHRVTGDTVLSANTVYEIRVDSSGTAWSLWVNQVAQTLTVVTANSGNWLGDVPGRDHVALGANVTSGGNLEPFTGAIGELVLAKELTAGQQSSLDTYFGA